MENVNLKFALSDSKIDCTRTEVSTGKVALSIDLG